MKSEKFAISSIKRSIADRTAPVTSSKTPLKAPFQGVVDVRAMKPSLANTSGLNNVGDALSEDGWAFEDRCAQILTLKGWKVEVTPGSGDYGVDLIAKKGINSVAIQCKRWSSAVGNKAVQEAFAGRGYYSTTHAAVVSISGYTKAATIQAERLNVFLLNLDELERLSVLLA